MRSPQPSAGAITASNDYLGYLGDRNYAPGTRRSYAFDLLALCRWLEEQHLRLDEVDAAALLRFLTSCRDQRPVHVPGDA